MICSIELKPKSAFAECCFGDKEPDCILSLFFCHPELRNLQGGKNQTIGDNPVITMA